MHPRLLTLPGGINIASYGACLAFGFASGIWLARRRARRVGADPTVILDIGLLAVVFGVCGARLLYVVHYWRDFANRPNPLLAIVDVSSGGIEFLGGFVCATVAIFVYLMTPKRVSTTSKERKRLPIRLYLDIVAPSLMWGLALTRIGCFLNGCCFGGACTVPGTREAAHFWAVSFPFGSPAFTTQWQQRQTTIPAELIRTSEKQLLSRPLNRFVLADSQDKNARSVVLRQQQYPSRAQPLRAISGTELNLLASHLRSLPIHPTQLYAVLSALSVSWFLSWLFYRRQRHGLVVVMLFMVYPIVRFGLEMIRTDNPHDTFGMTISQFISVLMFTASVVAIIVLYRWFPESSYELEPAIQREHPGRKRNGRKKARG